jgi:hypothetical protein
MKDRINFRFTHTRYFRETVEVQGEKIKMLWKYWFLGKDIMAIERLDPDKHLAYAKTTSNRNR